jgi:SAM-dependent methyltransferase
VADTKEPADAGSERASAADFDQSFAAADASPGLWRVWRAAEPDLPAEVEPFSFVSVSLLEHVAAALALAPGRSLADLACGRGGPGMWLARKTGARLFGIDFSSVAVEQARRRAGSFGLSERARFDVADLVATRLPDESVDAAVCVDAFHFAADLPRAARETFRILRPGRPVPADQLATPHDRRRAATTGGPRPRLDPASARHRFRRRRYGGET